MWRIILLSSLNPLEHHQKECLCVPRIKIDTHREHTPIWLFYIITTTTTLPLGLGPIRQGQQWNNSIWHEKLWHHTCAPFRIYVGPFHVSSQRWARCESVCQRRRGSSSVHLWVTHEYAAICWLTLIWVKLVPFLNQKKTQYSRMSPNYGPFSTIV
jgi:hypothetical protein